MKFNNLHGKIKSVRKRLGMTQKEFIKEIADRLDRSLSEPLASQWESNLPNKRTTPTPKQLAIMAELSEKSGSRKWETMAWFMLDEVPATTGVEIHPDGTYDLEPTWEMTEEDLEEMQKQHDAEREAYYNTPPDSSLTEWYDNPEKIYELRNKLFHPQSGVTKHKNVAVKLDGVEAKGSVGDVTSNSVKHKTANENKDAVPDGQSRIKDMVDSGVVNHLIARRPRCVEDVVVFSEKQNVFINTEAEKARLSGELTEYDDYQKKTSRFWEVVKYSLEDDHGILDPDTFFNQQIPCGEIKQAVGYFDGNTAIQFLSTIRTSSLTLLKLKIKEKMGELILVDRIRNRTSKKMVLLYLLDKNLDLTKLNDELKGYIQSAHTLGVTVKIASGHDQTAATIADFVIPKEVREEPAQTTVTRKFT